jgi:hypothetical protein
MFQTDIVDSSSLSECAASQFCFGHAPVPPINILAVLAIVVGTLVLVHWIAGRRS